MIDYLPLQVNTDYSMLDGAASVHSLADRAPTLGMKHLAITDHGNMFGALEFKDACLGTKDHPVEPIHPVIGSEFYMTGGSRLEKKGSESHNKPYHLILLAASREGYFNLLKLSSLSYTEGFYYKPRIDEELLQKYHGGLICLSACLAGELPRLLLAGREEEAEKRARFFRDLFGDDNFYLEIQNHGIPDELRAIPLLAALSRRTGIPLVATNDVHYLDPEDEATQDILLCISTGKKRSDEKRMHGQRECHFRTGDEMAALFPEFPEAIGNTVRIAERCVTDIPEIKKEDLPRYLPDFPIPGGFSGADAYLRHLTVEGLARRYPNLDETVRQRAEYELDVIIKMGFTGYFLIVEDFINWAKENDISVGPGRGSGAGSIVAYALRITDIDPLRYGLIFERFLNPSRISMPDFDVDFCNERRKEVMEYVTKKYGAERVGQIITFGTLKAKAVIKDVARVLDISIADSTMITDLVPDRNPDSDPDAKKEVDIAMAFELEPRLRELEGDPKYTELFALARKLEGKKRHASIHAAGMVIGKQELSDHVPLYRDSRTGIVATQFTMGFLERQGLVKMDFLAIKTLDLLRHTEELVRRRGGAYANFSIAGVPENDAATWRMLGEGKSSGLFQFESEGMQNILKQAKPDKVEDLIALNALYRPGPMQFIQQFIESKNGSRTIRYPDPCLEDILKETYGVIVYQEQVMQVAQRIAGYSMGEADKLRKAMGKKKKEIIAAEKAPFIAGAVKQGFSAEAADRIYEILAPFAGYGFNKSHSTAYAILAYQTAYLKANFPAEFMAANLTNEINSPPEKRAEYIDEALRMGIAIDPPDVNRSDRFYTVSEGRIVYGLTAVKGIGEKPAEEIVGCRKDGPYRDFIDFLNRVDIKTVGKKVIELLIEAGAFDRFGMDRGKLLGNLEAAVNHVQRIKEDRKEGQSLFGDSGEKEYPDFKFSEFPETGRDLQLEKERELLGFYASGHPMDPHRDTWTWNADINLAATDRAPEGNYTLVGIIKNLRTLYDKKNKEMCFAVLSDYNGEADVMFFASVWEKCRDEIEVDRIAALRVKLDRSRNRTSFLVNSVADIEKMAKAAVRAKAAGAPPLAAAGARYGSPKNPEAAAAEPQEPVRRRVHIRLKRDAAAQEQDLVPLRDQLLENPGSCSVYIHVPLQAGETVIRTTTQLETSSDGESMSALKNCAGVAEVWCE
ncbi:MAG: DNA polymerase III subunit alpha [Treponema sp.]|jgi:DNA polymerase-3 subunit alpha|nr:DNA polymerase III subunit alpha [Treponema sp.]